MREIRRKYPKIHTYRIPWYYHACKHMYIKNLSLKQVFDINEWVQNKVYWGKDIDDELVAAVGWRMAKHHSVRWNWRGTLEDRDGEQVWVPADLGENLYPSRLSRNGIGRATESQEPRRTFRQRSAIVVSKFLRSRSFAVDVFV
jgi:hypothetical protein